MRLSCRLAYLVIGILLPAAVATGAPVFRLHSAKAVLLLQQPFPRTSESDSLLVLYREPGVGRIAALTFPQAIQKIPSFAWDGEKLYVPAAGQRRGWIRIPYDEAGREGWLRLEREWQVMEWSDLLPGMQVHLIAGIKKAFYVLQPEPGIATGDTILSADEPLWILALQGEWAQVETGQPRQEGWIRWRDDDGRFTVAPLPPENH